DGILDLPSLSLLKEKPEMVTDFPGDSRTESPIEKGYDPPSKEDYAHQSQRRAQNQHEELQDSHKKTHTPRVSRRSKSSAHELPLLREFEAEVGHDFLQILPYFAFRGRVPEQVGRVVSGHEFGAVEVEPFAAESGDALGGLQQGLRGAAAEGADDFGGD